MTAGAAAVRMRPLAWRSLRLHILAAFLLLLGAFALVLAIVAGRSAQGLIDETASQAFDARAALALQDLRRLEETAKAAAEALAANPVARATAREAREDRLYALATILRSGPGVSAAYLGWPNGEFVLLRPADPREIGPTPPAGAVWLLQWVGPDGMQVRFLDGALDEIGASGGAGFAFDPRTRPWFVDARTTDATVITAPYIFFTTREPGVSAARRAASGAIAGVDVSLWDLSRRLPYRQPVPSAEAAILDHHGGVLAHGDADRLRRVVGTAAEIRDAEALPPVGRFGSPVLTALAERLRGAPGSFRGTLSIEGRDWVAAITPLDRLDAALVMAAPIDEFGGASRSLHATILWVFALATLIAVPSAWLAARSIARPVEVFSGDMQRVAKLDFGGPPRSRARIAELADLEDAIGSMRGSLAAFEAVCRIIIEEREIPALLDGVVGVLMSAGGADRGAAWLSEGDAGPLRPVARRGPPFDEDAVAERLAAAAEILVFIAPTAAGPATVLGLPLRTRSGRLVGALMVMRPDAARLPASLLPLGAFVARTLALSIDRPRLVAEREAARRETELVLDSVADGIHVLDAAGRVRRQNPAAAALLQRSDDEVVGAVWYDLVRPHGADGDPVPESRTAASRSLIDGETRSGENEVFRRRDGTPLAVEYACSALRDTDGGVAGAVVSFRDVTERHRIRAEADEWRRRLERLVDHATVGILVHRDFRPILANRELARIFGRGDAAAILALEDWRTLVVAADRERLAGYYAARLEGREAPALYRVAGIRPDGRRVVMEIRAFAIEWGDGPAAGAMVTDITQQLEVEEQLRRAQRLDAIGQLTGGVAHDFNNLLTVILGNAELLADGLAGDERLRSLAEMAAKAAERGAELTARLLAFARRQSLDPRPTDVNRHAAAMEGLLRRTLGAHVELSVVPAADPATALVDAAQLDSAILNLCLNARDAMPDGGSLTVETANVRIDGRDAARLDIAPGRYVSVAVRDTGQGMDEATQSRAFEPFFTTKQVGKGSGLGLSMVYGFVKQSNGHVRIESAPGRGTVVTLFLPEADADEIEAGRPQDVAAGGSETILVVEDDELVRSHVQGQLAALGYAAVVVGSGPEAMRALDGDRRIDLLFTDIVMPGGMSGRELAEAARKRRPSLPVLFTSGYSADAVFREGRLEQGTHLLPKPYRRRELAAKVRAALDGADPH